MVLSKEFVFRIYNFIFSLPTNSKTELVFVGSVYTKKMRTPNHIKFTGKQKYVHFVQHS